MKEQLANISEKIKQSFQSLSKGIRTYFKNQPKWKIVLHFGLIGFAAVFGFILSLTIFTYQGSFGKVPGYQDLKEIRNYNASEVYAEDGDLLGKYYIENRVNADFEEISLNVINALIATEDARFFDHKGIDYRAWIRVLLRTVILSDKAGGGGSTLSQQLAKNLYPRKSHPAFSIMINKIKEMIIARRLEKLYSKEELLRLYLNTVPFSENIFGVKVAAQRFFNKTPDELEPHEAAVLVGMLKATTTYNPIKNPERSLQRRNVVLYQMLKYNYIDSLAYKEYVEKPIELSYYKEGNNEGIGTYFREHLRLELEEILKNYRKPDGGKYNLYTDGLKIYTSINASMQQYAEQAVAENMPKLQANFYKDWKKRDPLKRSQLLQKEKKKSKRYQSLKTKGYSESRIDTIFNQKMSMTIFNWDGDREEKEMSAIDSIRHYLTLLHTGLLAVEPGTGLIRAWVGGVDHEFFQYDHVKSKRQVGSTFKPIVYACALESGMMPCEYTSNQRVRYEKYNNWEPRNSDGEYGGVYSMEGALSKSINVVTVEVLERAGIDEVIELAKDMGIDSSIPEVPAISLGAVDASLMEMVKVYSTFANKGKTPELHYLDRIETADGELIAEFSRPNPQSFRQSLSPNYNEVMVKMMEAVVDSGTAKKLRYTYGLRNDIAGKTGTTQNQSDGWFLGFTPKISAGVWVGADHPEVHFRTLYRGQGASTALPIWGSFMKKVHTDKQFKSWKRASFPGVTDTTLALMQCPHYLEEMPIMVNYWEEEYEKPSLFKRLFGRKNGETEVTPGSDTYINVPPRKAGETQADYGERIQEIREEKVEDAKKQEKRKKFWSKLLFGKKKKEGEQ